MTVLFLPENLKLIDKLKDEVLDHLFTDHLFRFLGMFKGILASAISDNPEIPIYNHLASLCDVLDDDFELENDTIRKMKGLLLFGDSIVAKIEGFKLTNKLDKKMQFLNQLLLLN